VNGTAEAQAYGAATIVNAIATGKGAAVGVDLQTQASVEITTDADVIDSRITSDPLESTVLIEKTVHRVFQNFNLDGKLGANVTVRSTIPIGRGLKSSSAAGNAIALATVAALNKDLDDLAVIGLGIDAAIEAEVTITGAFDDACASYLGGAVLTDNVKREIIKRFAPRQDLRVLLFVPPSKAYTYSSNILRMRNAAPLVRRAFQKALRGAYWTALSVNGLIYSSALGYDPSIAIDALKAGALAAGLSGTGPAVTAVVADDSVDLVKTAWARYEGHTIQTQINHRKAHVIKGCS
jgi:shikimate kinase